MPNYENVSVTALILVSIGKPDTNDENVIWIMYFRIIRFTYINNTRS